MCGPSSTWRVVGKVPRPAPLRELTLAKRTKLYALAALEARRARLERRKQRPDLPAEWWVALACFALCMLFMLAAWWRVRL